MEIELHYYVSFNNTQEKAITKMLVTDLTVIFGKE